MKLPVLRIVLLMAMSYGFAAHVPAPAFKAVVVAERDANHGPMVDAAIPFIRRLAGENNFTVDFIESVDPIDDAFLAGYQLFIQLNWTPIGWGEEQQRAFQRYIEQGKGWVGIHHAGLTGERVLRAGRKNWTWYQDRFFGGVRYTDYITPPVKATVVVEDRNHPATRNLPGSFEVLNDEWYEFDGSPRPNVHVLATVDESTYVPKKPMGDHPVVWTNEIYGRVIYILMGHDAGIFQNRCFTTLLRDAIVWAGSGAPRGERR
jgi:type 1 glutamine amidotransferase